MKKIDFFKIQAHNANSGRNFCLNPTFLVNLLAQRLEKQISAEKTLKNDEKKKLQAKKRQNIGIFNTFLS